MPSQSVIALLQLPASKFGHSLPQPIEASEQDQSLAGQLIERMSPQELALALVRAHRSRMPEPEELTEITARGEGTGSAPSHHRAGFEDVVWFRMDIGRRHNADPRWLLPLLCRRGHITRNEIGAIRITPGETFFQVPRAIEAKFRDALARTSKPGDEDEAGITIERSADPAPGPARKGASNAGPGSVLFVCTW